MSNGILRGRPFGGVHVLVKSDLCKFVKYVYCSDRFVIISFKNIIILNLYLPSVVNNDDESRLIDLLADIQINLDLAVSAVINPILVVGGDFNLDFE